MNDQNAYTIARVSDSRNPTAKSAILWGSTDRYKALRKGARKNNLVIEILGNVCSHEGADALATFFAHNHPETAMGVCEFMDEKGIKWGE